MRYSIDLRVGVTSLLLLAAPAARGQQKPTADQAKALLQSRPDLVSQLKQRLLTSGMTPDQVRARLRAEGYPPDLLDAYLPGTGSADSAATPNEDVYGAIVKLGIADSTDVARLRLADSTYRLRTDSTSRDTVRDSLRASLRDSLRLSSLGLPRGVSGAAAVQDSGYYIFGLEVFHRA